jgi:uncharacterized protein DUF1579
MIAWLLVSGLLGPSAQPPDVPPSQPPPAASAARPSVDHDRLDVLSGTWSFEQTLLVPGKAPERTVGTSENRWVLGNRYLECRAREGPDGAENLQIYGFDTQRRLFFSVAVGSRGTGYRNLEGFYDQPTRSFILLGKDPGDGRNPGPKLRQILHIESRDRHVIELFLIGTGQLPRKVAEITFTRQ